MSYDPALNYPWYMYGDALMRKVSYKSVGKGKNGQKRKLPPSFPYFHLLLPYHLALFQQSSFLWCFASNSPGEKGIKKCY